MIEYLEKLVADKEYQKALDYAEQLLLHPDNTSWDLMVIYTRLCQARFETGEFYGAQVAGQLALRMAKELEAWDYYGVSALWLGTSYVRLHQLENALSAWYDYLAFVPYYRDAKQYHVNALYNIGLAQGEIGKHEESLHTLQKAADVAMASKNHRKAHGIQHALINAHLRYGNLHEIPALLAKCAHYLRTHTTANNHTQSYLWHLVLRVRFALATNRLGRAKRVAQRALRLAEGWPVVTFELRLLLARVHEQCGDMRVALEEAVRARSMAIEARRYDLEFAAADYVYSLLTAHEDLEESLQNTIVKDWNPSGP